MSRKLYYIQPPREVYAAMDCDDYLPGFRTYAEYNYLQPGIASRIKTRHFEVALKLTERFFHRCNVIDFGCADGVFLPSLSKHFKQVLAVDRHANFLKCASSLAATLGLSNVEVRSAEDLWAGNEQPQKENTRYKIMYLLEIIEHVGSQGALYETKINFLRKMASLLDEDGILVVSVPKMVGLPFLFQRMGLAALRLHREDISLANLLKAGLFSNTDDLEKNWRGEYSHLGFNHKKLERFIGKDFYVRKRKHLLFQMLYVLQKK